MIGSALCALVALAFISLGVGSYVAPGALAENYGLPVSNATEVAYLRAVGTRDLVLGLLVAKFLLSDDSRPALRTTIAVSVLVAASDFSVVLGARGFEAKKSLAIHGSGVGGLMFIRALLASEL